MRGLEEMRIRLGVAQPDEHVSVFNDATKRLTDRLTHLYTRAQRYWYDTHPNLRRTMEDRQEGIKRRSDTQTVLTTQDGITGCNSVILGVQFILTMRACW